MNWLPRTVSPVPLELPPRPGVKSYTPPMNHARRWPVIDTCPLCQSRHMSLEEFNLCKEWYAATK